MSQQNTSDHVDITLDEQIEEVLKGRQKPEVTSALSGDLYAAFGADYIIATLRVELEEPGDESITGYDIFLLNPANQHLGDFVTFDAYDEEDVVHLRNIQGRQLFRVDPEKLPSTVTVQAIVYFKKGQTTLEKVIQNPLAQAG